MNIGLGPLLFDINASRDIVAQGIRENAGDATIFLAEDASPFLLPDPEYPHVYQVWFPLADGSGILHVNPDGEIQMQDGVDIIAHLPGGKE